MEHQKILSNEANDSEFVTKNDNSKENYGKGNEITYKTEVLELNLCDYNNAYILVIDDCS